MLLHVEAAPLHAEAAPLHAEAMPLQVVAKKNSKLCTNSTC